MDSISSSVDKNNRKIEDIIDVQKANGNFNNIRQVAFILPSNKYQEVSTEYAKSLESGLTKNKFESNRKKKVKKNRSKRRKNPTPDVISWPSDSDITVLRMKLCLTKTDLNKQVGNIVPGDGLHKHDSSSMVNLATLMRQTTSASKHSIAMEEYLLPLTSWEQQSFNKDPTVEKTKSKDYLAEHRLDVYEALCSRVDGSACPKGSEMSIITSKKSKIARFLRLYFCPCCTCLYKWETMKDQPSAYFSKQNED